MIDFAGANVIVTGGSGALGGAVVAALRRARAICYLPSSSTTAVESPNRDNGTRMTPGIDLTNEVAVEDFYRSVPDLWGSVHLVGGFLSAPIAETTTQAFDAQFSANFRTCFLCTRAAVTAIRARNKAFFGGAFGGRIVNVAARPALEPRSGAGMAVYAAAKAAVSTFTQALAEELTPEQIWVNAVAPSTLDTPVNRAASPESDFTRWVAPADLADVIAFLASPQNRATRGAVLPVYAGS